MPRTLKNPEATGPSEQFATREQLNAYLNSESICCLICRRVFTVLPAHIKAAHSMSPEEYKTRFGIPLRFGLAGTKFRDASRRRMLALVKEGRIAGAPTRETVERLLESRRARVRPLPEFLKRENLEKILQTHGKADVWSEDVFHELLRRVRTGRIVGDVCNDPDMPSRKALMNFLNHHPLLRAKYVQIWENMPFNMQVKANKTGDRYRRTIIDLHRQGKNSRQIGEIMDIRPSTIRNALRLIRRKYLNLLHKDDSPLNIN